MEKDQQVWVFCGEGSRLPAGAFSSKREAEQWIARHRVSGLLTAYPLDLAAYDWAIQKGYFAPKRDDQRTADFIQKFSSASQEHFHYSNGEQT